jgi:hypothetical protein
MEENIQSQPAPVEVTSFATRAVNALTAPGELYAEVAAAPVQNSSWLIPFLVMVALVGLMMFSFTNNAVLYDQMREPQRAEMAKQVAEGKMTQEQADTAMGFINNKGIFIAFGIAGGVLFTTIIVFGAPLVYWAASKGVLKFAGNYKKILEVYGLSMVVGIVGTLVSLIMMNMMESMYAQPSGAFFLRDSYEQGNFVHNLAASMNVFSIWQVAVTGIGLSAVSGKSRGMGLGLAFGLWLVYVLIASYLGWGAR